uniref:Ribosomal protein L14 n=1 Tax=Chloroparvula japonica TaxID=1411623 RepID=A0A4D6C6X2_9CHLO|nr:ribosomal protein L14 [Chloroparvula japonica]QBX98779.1 ribosomal protein L14 [Chloroparvula japonica]
MLVPGSVAKVCDNSGATSLKCIRVVNGSYAGVGDTIVGVVQSCSPNSKYPKGTVQRAVVFNTKKSLRRYDGSSVRFDANTVALINPQGNPLGTRVFGPACHDLRKKGHTKLVSLAKNVI